MSNRNIVVIGAGIVGVATAIHLQRDGNKVILIDREGPAAGASAGNAGVIVPSGVVPVNVPGLIAKIPRMLASSSSPLFVHWRYLPRMSSWLLRYLRHANATDAAHAARALRAVVGDSVAQHRDLAAQTPAQKWIEASDYVFVYDRRADFDADAFAWSMRDEVGIEWEAFDAEQFAQYDPHFSSAGQHAVRIGGHARITDPKCYVQDLAAHFEQQGGEMRRATARTIIGDAHGVRGVDTDSGVIECDCAVVACGAWSKHLLESIGLTIPLESERGYHVDFINPSAYPRSSMMIAAAKLAVTPMVNRIRCAGLVEFGGLDAPRNRAATALIKRCFAAAWPRIEYERTEEWMGHRPALVDSIPCIGGIERMPNLYAGFGHHHVGLTAGAKTGRIIADLIAGNDAGIDLTPYRPSRFT